MEDDFVYDEKKEELWTDSYIYDMYIYHYTIDLIVEDLIKNRKTESIKHIIKQIILNEKNKSLYYVRKCLRDFGSPYYKTIVGVFNGKPIGIFEFKYWLQKAKKNIKNSIDFY